MKPLNSYYMSGAEVLPLVEGGKGVAVSNGLTAGSWARAGGIGTISCTNADSYDADGNPIPQVYRGKTRRERFEELKAYAIRGGIEQARIAHETAGGQGRIHINVLWEAGGTIPILHGIMDAVGDLIHGITCGAGMPYKVAEIAAQYGKYYYPIVSSARAFNALWRRAYKNYRELLGGVVYEDPWRAGGHNGLSNVEDPNAPQDPYPRVLELRKVMNAAGLDTVPIIIAGGVWYLRDWEDWIDNPELGPIAFQYGTRPLLTKESPISAAWKERLLNLKEGDVLLNRFSPTGFYSSAIRNEFLQALEARSARQIEYRAKADEDPAFSAALPLGPRGRPVYIKPEDLPRVQEWMDAGFSEGLKTPDHTLVFETPQEAREIITDQGECMGCLSQCRFSNWADNAEFTTGKRADPRSFCIQKALQRAAHGGDLDRSLMFAGHNAYKFSEDPFYAGGRIPTVQELVERILTGD